ncbi:DNA ligase [Thalassotalea profundi]|uniref:ATP-dependent DNA ligase n=1 Tax=Thalassotalea profundi TaxID=2036687 RepID=A0ABQ3IZN3_9GAMM|nr:DNA ligase [Thalassotalea profundi]GHE99380.1 ATP-dependent DNA ligase [Thalassotalea profundi]
MKVLYGFASILFILLYSFSAFAENLPIQHGINYHNSLNINDYWISEKLDGIRGYWTGKKLLTRQGNPIYTPQGYTDNWPKTPLDGELWSNRGEFQRIVSCTRKKVPEPECWKAITFKVFDLPTSKINFTQRINKIQNIIEQSQSTTISMVEQFSLTNETQLYNKLNQVVSLGGEGLMLHHKQAIYKIGRNKALLKLKPYQDEEAIVLKHIPGKGKYKDMLGSLLVRNKQGFEFKIGTGFSDKERQQPPAIGSEITYKYIGKTDRGVPRFASFLRIKQ